MPKARIIFALSVALFLIACHLAYLSAFANGRQTEFASQIDQPTIKLLSLALLVGIVIFAWIKPTSEEAQT